jgi:hypothetical protein
VWRENGFGRFAQCHLIKHTIYSDVLARLMTPISPDQLPAFYFPPLQAAPFTYHRHLRFTSRSIIDT